MTEGFWNVWNQTVDLVLRVDEHTGVLIWYYTWPILLNILPIYFEFVFLFMATVRLTYLFSEVCVWQFVYFFSLLCVGPRRMLKVRPSTFFSFRRSQSCQSWPFSSQGQVKV